MQQPRPPQPDPLCTVHHATDTLGDGRVCDHGGQQGQPSWSFTIITHALAFQPLLQMRVRKPKNH